MTVRLSCTLITKNEEDRIGACLEALKDLADDIVVVDSGSKDNTVAIAKAFGARVFHNDWVGYGQQKRFAETQAQYDWILNLDADEVLTPELSEEIRTLLQTEPPYAAYKMRIRNVYPNRSEPRLWADYHNYVRLYDRRRVRFRDSSVHDTVDVAGHPVGQLRGSVKHFSSRSYAHIRAKLDSYTDLQAKVLKKPLPALLLRLPFEYPLVFLRYYLFRCHFTGGWDGIYTSHIAASARVKRLTKMLAVKFQRSPDGQ